MNRINDKIKEIDGFLQELSETTPQTFEEYEKSFKEKAACERYFEKIITAVIDLAFLFIKYKKYDIPNEDKEAIELLSNNGIINENLSENLKSAKSMRNIIAHEYGQVDDELVFEAITEQLEKDVREFIKSIENNLK
jgi:uncharacterized protein YutE (UPF0331/DUF86 family)